MCIYIHAHMVSITFVCLRSWNRPLPSFHWLQFSPCQALGVYPVWLFYARFSVFPTWRFTMKSPKRLEISLGIKESSWDLSILPWIPFASSAGKITWMQNSKKTWGRHCMVDPDQLSVWKKNTSASWAFWAPQETTRKVPRWEWLEEA